MHELPGFVAGLGILLFGLLYFVLLITVTVIVLMSLWRGMKAQESMAKSLKTISETQSRGVDLPKGDGEASGSQPQ